MKIKYDMEKSRIIWMNGLLVKGMIMLGSEQNEDSQYYEMIKRVE